MAEPLTEEEIVRRAECAGRLLYDTDLMLFLREQQQDILACIGLTEPEQNKQRSDLYFEHRGIESFIARLQTYVAAAVQIIDKQESNTD